MRLDSSVRPTIEKPMAINPITQRLILIPSLILLTSCSYIPFGRTQVNVPVQFAVDANAPFTNKQYSKLLAEYVDDKGLVNYEALQQNRQPLDLYYAQLAAVTPATFNSWNAKEQLAYLMNAYNALTLLSIIDQNPLKPSIRDIPGVWNANTFKVAGKSQTLDNIEHDTIRPTFNEPRIHAALVCAAMSCPPLRNEPYTAAQIDQQLDDQVKAWLALPEVGFRIDRQRNKVYLSKIFDWYGDDWKPQFAVEAGFSGDAKQKAVLNFISRYLSPEDRAYLQAGKYQVGYLDYDWSLNRQ